MTARLPFFITDETLKACNLEVIKKYIQRIKQQDYTIKYQERLIKRLKNKLSKIETEKLLNK